MKLFRRHIFFRVLCVLLALHIFNISVDMPDAQPDYIAEDLSVNDQESVVELILEKVLGIDNAVEEYDDTDETDASNFELVKDFKFYSRPVTSCFISLATIVTQKAIPFQNSFYSSYVNDITPPPPKA